VSGVEMVDHHGHTYRRTVRPWSAGRRSLAR
jgi:hypothetical protein